VQRPSLRAILDRRGWIVRRSTKAVITAVCLLTTVTPARAAAAEHCATRLVPLEPAGGVTAARLEPIGCFATFAEALEAGTGTRIDVSWEMTPATLTAETAAELSTASSVVIGTEYDSYSYGGGSQSYFAPETCSSGVIWGVANVGFTWNDRFQSGKGFGGCDTNRKFQHEDFGGEVKTCTPNCTTYGTLANEVTSLRWRP
jgi:hypothetical protein